MISAKDKDKTKKYQEFLSSPHQQKDSITISRDPWNIQKRKRCISYVNFSNFYLGHPRRTSTSAFLPKRNYNKKGHEKRRRQQKRHGIFDDTVDLLVLPLQDHRGVNVSKSLFFVRGKKSRLKRSKQSKEKPKVHFRVFNPDLPEKVDRKRPRYRTSSTNSRKPLIRPKTSLGFRHDHIKRKSQLRIYNTKNFIPGGGSSSQRRVLKRSSVSICDMKDRISKANTPKSGLSTNRITKETKDESPSHQEERSSNRQTPLRRSFSMTHPMSVEFHQKRDVDENRKKKKKRIQHSLSVRPKKRTILSTRIRRRNSFQIVKRKRFVSSPTGSSSSTCSSSRISVINNEEGSEKSKKKKNMNNWFDLPSTPQKKKKRPSTTYPTSKTRKITSSWISTKVSKTSKRPASAFPRQRNRFTSKNNYEKSTIVVEKEEEETTHFHQNSHPIVSLPLSIIGECVNLDDEEDDDHNIEEEEQKRKMIRRKRVKNGIRSIWKKNNKKENNHHQKNSFSFSGNKRRSLDDRNVIVTVKRCFIRGKEKPLGIVLPRPRVLYD